MRNITEKSIYSFLSKRLAEQANKTLIHRLEEGMWKEYSAKTILDWSNRLALDIKSYRIKEGYRVGILAGSSPEWVVAALALWQLNATVVLLSDMVTPEENIVQIRQTDLSGVLLSDDMYKEFQTALPNEVPLFLIHQQLDLIDNPGRPKYFVQPDIADLDPNIAVMVLTSGTTGHTKVVAQSHLSLITQAESEIYKKHYFLSDPIFSVLPYFHIYPLVAIIILSISYKVGFVQIDKLDLDNIQKAFKEKKPRGLITTPRLLEAIQVKAKVKMSKMGKIKMKIVQGLLDFSYWLNKKMGLKGFGKLVFKDVFNVFGGRMNNITCGGAPLDPDLKRFLESCGLEIHVGYGLSETTGPVTYDHDNDIRPGSVGPSVPGIEIGIDQPDATGIGEVKVKGNLIMDYYFRNPEDTKTAIINEWFYTGDVGYLDKDQHLLLTGRKKELIVSSTGKKTSPAEIEAIFEEMPFVDEMAALGVQEKTGSGDEVYLAVVVRDTIISDMTMDQKRKSISDEVSRRNSKLPQRLKVQHVYFAETLPKTNLGKVKRKALAEVIRIENSQKKKAKSQKKSNTGDHIQEDVLSILSHIAKNSNNIEVKMHMEELGMDSLMALQFFNVLKQKYGDKINPDWIYENPTVEELATAIKTGDAPFMKHNDEHKQDLFWYRNYRWKRGAEEEQLLLNPLKTDNVLITGVTGVLGGKLLLDILNDTKANIYCLTRSSSNIRPIDRILNILALYNDDKEISKDFIDRIHIVEGDLLQENLGIQEELYQKLAETVDVIIHMAAKVSLHGVYADLADNNVGGTQRMIEFALKTKQKYLVYISSYSVFGNALNDKDMPLTEEDMDVGQKFPGLGYQQTKFESEVLVRAARDKGLNWIIIRPGDIYGDSSTGHYPLGMTSVDGIYYQLLKAIAETGVVANSKRFHDITPVDYVSKGIRFFTFDYNRVFGTYHLKNPVIIRFSDLVGLLQKMGFMVDVVDIEYYKKLLDDNRLLVNSKPYYNPALNLIKFRPEEFLSETKTYVDARRTAEILAKHDIMCPYPDEQLLQTYLGYCVQIGFLVPPSVS